MHIENFYIHSIDYTAYVLAIKSNKIEKKIYRTCNQKGCNI